MNAETTRIKVANDLEVEFPAELDNIGENLANVPFDMLMLEWDNPRRLGEIQGTTMGRGFDPQEMQELYSGLQKLGQLLPLICRWVLFPDGTLKVQVGDGERRYRCIKRLRERNESSWSQKEMKLLPAKEVYDKVFTRIVIGKSEEWPTEANGCRYSCTDKEMLEVAFKVTANAVGWGEGANAKLIKKMRQGDYTDAEIIEETGKSSQWLREMDEICSLDELTFTYLTDDRINRALALRLSKIEELERRHRYLHASYDDAVSNHQEDLAAADADLEKAEQREETAEAELEEAKRRGDVEAEVDATQKLDNAKQRTQRKRRQRQEASRPTAKTKNLRNAAAKIAEEEGDDGVPDDVAQALRPGKIQAHLEEINGLIANNGKDEDGKEILSVATLYVLAACYRSILAGESDILKVLRRSRNIMKLQSARKNQPPPDIAADMDEDEEGVEDEDDPLEDEMKEGDDDDD